MQRILQKLNSLFQRPFRLLGLLNLISLEVFQVAFDQEQILQGSHHVVLIHNMVAAIRRGHTHLFIRGGADLKTAPAKFCRRQFRSADRDVHHVPYSRAQRVVIGEVEDL